MSIFRIPSLFMIFLILFAGCKDDSNIPVDQNATEQEKQYFRDYVSPPFKWGFINKKGDFKIEAKYDDLRDFKDGVACVSYLGKWGMIDREGATVIPFQYLDIQDFSEGIALVEDFNKNKFYINKENEPVIKCPFESCYAFESGLARYNTGDFSGFLDKEGQPLGGMRFTSASDFNGEYAIISIADDYGVINKSGERVIKTKYDKIKIGEGIAMLQQGDQVEYRKMSNPNKTLKTVARGTIFIDGYAAVLSEGNWGVLDTNFNFTPFSKGKIRYLNEQRWAAKGGNGYKIVNEKGDAISDQIYTNIFKYHCGIAGVEIDKAWGYIDLNGNEILKPSLPIIWDCSEGLVRFISNAGFGYFDRETNIQIAPQFIESRDFVESLARAQNYQN